MIRNLATLLADLAGYNSGILRARAAYHLRDLSVCRHNHAPRPKGERCRACVAEGNRRRKGAA